MKLVLAEKPSVAMSLSKVIGANQRGDGYMEGNGYLVSWCVGHLVELSQPEAYDEKYAKWKYDDLPILPEHWQYQVSASTKKQFGILKKLMQRKDVESLICATDAGREGELIFRLVYHQCGCKKPVERLWISSMEDSAIREGFQKLRPGTEYDALYEAALCRERADWIVGINATRLFSCLYGQTLNVGRVMTPTLAMVVMRDAAIRAFKPEPFYSAELKFRDFQAGGERMKEKAEAEKLVAECCQAGSAIITKVEQKEKSEKPPALFDLTSLQREANRQLGFTAQQTLDYTQALYEKKLVTYPRMVFVGNINQSVDVLLKTSSLFDPFPPEMGTDTAFLDRLHCYIPGWEIPKFRPEHFTNDYGFITDYLAEFIRELRKEQYGDALDKYFRLGKNLNQRDTIAVRKIVGGYVKLLYPDGEFTKEQIEEILVFALEMRRRVKEQLKKLGGMEFYDVNFSYIDLDTFEEKFVSVPEQGGGKLIPDGICNPGQVYTVSQGKSGMIGVFRLESQMLPGNGKFERTGLGSDRDCKESTNTAFNFLKANGNRISGSISTTMRDYIINYQDLQGIGMTGKLALPTLIALCSIALGRPTVSTLAVLGEISISGTILKVDELANSLQVCLDSGAKKVLLPITSAADLGTVPPELVGSFNLIFYSSAEDAVFKALGVE